ncbi:hypothetical protein VRB67_22205 [Pseudomonas trivialis]|uniref:hypothetical protein n=1 Tax=Pseudomonas trivialis TaxID=200450 RepID=UPI0030D41651
MKTMLGVAAVILMGAPIAHASVKDAKEISELTTKKQTITPTKLLLQLLTGRDAPAA